MQRDLSSRCSASSTLRGISGGTKEVDEKKRDRRAEDCTRGEFKKVEESKEEEEVEKEVKSGGRILAARETRRQKERV